MIEAKNIVCKIKEKVILKEVDLRIHPGQFTVVVGANGAGKSTLLKIISGESGNYKGSVTINEKNINSYKPEMLSKIRSVLPQQSTVNFPYTSKEIIEMGRLFFKDKKEVTHHLINHIIEITGIKHLSNRIYGTLSGGEQQKVQLARIIAQIWNEDQAHRFILLDEPTASLDMAQQHHILGLAKKMCKNNIGVMAIIHDLNLAVQYADHILFLKNGKEVAQGPVEKIINKGVIEETFLHKVQIVRNTQNGIPYIIPEPIKPIINEPLINYQKQINHEQFSN